MATQNQILENAYRGLLTTWQIPMTPAVVGFMRKMAAQGASTTAFVQEFRKTKPYAQRFVGIFRKNGTMRMSESQYISGYQNARDYAGSLGRPFSLQAYGLALANGNSPSEIKAKLVVADKLKEFRQQLTQFNDYLIATGKIKKPLERKEVQDYLLGQRGDLQREWDNAHTAFQLEQQADVQIGRPSQGGDIGIKRLDKMLKRFKALGGNVDDIDYAEIGRLAKDVIPKAQLYGGGITERDIVNMAFKGKDADDTMKRIENVLTTYNLAVTEPGAQSQTYAGRVNMGTPDKGSE